MLDEVHHLPALSDVAPDPLASPSAPDEAAGWSRALLPLFELARLRRLNGVEVVELVLQSAQTLPAELTTYFDRY